MVNRFEIQSNTLRRLDWASAVREELAGSRTLLPLSPLRNAMRARAGDYGDFVAASAARGLLSPTTSLVAPKSDHGLRNLTVIGLDLSVLYHALVGRVRASLPQPRTDEYQDVMGAPLGESGTTHVLSADISAFYQYVDHGIVSDEIVSWSGDGDVAAGVFDFLAQVTGRSFGLPQVHIVSDLLAELLLDRLERKLMRGGYAVQHYSDDFRVACRSRSDAWEAWVALNEEATRMGLSLNDSKTIVRGLSDYSEYLSAPDDRWNELAGEVSDSFTGLNPYTDEWIEVEADDYGLLEGTARQALQLWDENTGNRGSLRPLDAIVYQRIMRKALQYAHALESDAALPYLHRVITRAPFETRAASRYLRKLLPHAKVRALDSLVTQVGSSADYLLPWQTLWLVNSARPTGEHELPTEPLGPTTQTWLESLRSAPHADVVRAHAIMVLTLYGLMEPSAVVDAIDQLHPSTRDVLVAALALRIDDPNDRLLKAAVNGYQPHRWLVAHVHAEREVNAQVIVTDDVPW